MPAIGAGWWGGLAPKGVVTKEGTLDRATREFFQSPAGELGLAALSAVSFMQPYFGNKIVKTNVAGQSITQASDNVYVARGSFSAESGNLKNVKGYTRATVRQTSATSARADIETWVPEQTVGKNAVKATYSKSFSNIQQIGETKTGLPVFKVTGGPLKIDFPSELGGSRAIYGPGKSVTLVKTASTTERNGLIGTSFKTYGADIASKEFSFKPTSPFTVAPEASKNIAKITMQKGSFFDVMASQATSETQNLFKVSGESMASKMTKAFPAFPSKVAVKVSRTATSPGLLAGGIGVSGMIKGTSATSGERKLLKAISSQSTTTRVTQKQKTFRAVAMVPKAAEGTRTAARAANALSSSLSSQMASMSKALGDSMSSLSSGTQATKQRERVSPRAKVRQSYRGAYSPAPAIPVIDFSKFGLRWQPPGAQRKKRRVLLFPSLSRRPARWAGSPGAILLGMKPIKRAPRHYAGLAFRPPLAGQSRKDFRNMFKKFKGGKYGKKTN
jgi:hypothetical protein